MQIALTVTLTLEHTVTLWLRVIFLVDSFANCRFVAAIERDKRHLIRPIDVGPFDWSELVEQMKNPSEL